MNSKDTTTSDAPAAAATGPGRPALIALDWGTSSFRAAVVDRDGRTIAGRSADAGILKVADRAFVTVLEREVRPLVDVHGALPILASGMIGSRNGWVEVAYVPCPADLADVAAGVVTHHEADWTLHFVPGLDHLGPGDVPDVMRGEEVQVFGAIGAGSGRVVLPGTHSKWVDIAEGRITGFRTFMTGEIFAALRAHTILGRLASGDGFEADGFARGVAAGFASPALLHTLFSIRTLPLTGRLPAEAVVSYLSGMLVGAEFAGATAGGAEMAIGTPIVVIGSSTLAERYRLAAEILGLAVTIGPEDAAARGVAAIARANGLI